MGPTGSFDSTWGGGGCGCHDILTVQHVLHVAIFPPDPTFDFFFVLSCFCGNRIHSFPTEPALIAKSSILLDVKPWDDETDMAKLEECVRSIQMDGLIWGQCKCNIQMRGREHCSKTTRFGYWWILMVCRCDDDLTHHLSAEQEMKLNDLKPLQRVTIQIKLMWQACYWEVLGLIFFLVCLAKLVPVGYGIKKLQIGCVVEDDKVFAFSLAVGGWVVKTVSLDFPVCSSGGHRHPGGAHHCLWGLCSVDGCCSFQQDLKMRDYQ